MSLAAIILDVSWLAFMAVWGIGALKAKKNIRNRKWWTQAIGLRVLVILVFFLVIVHSPHLGETFAFSHSNLALAGSLICMLGVALAIWARVYLGRNWGMPMSVKENPELVTGGPYNYIRNPIYSGVILALLGTALVIGPLWLVVFAVMIGYFIYSVFAEEHLMIKEFPDTYPAYKARTKRLVPFIW